MQARSYHFFVRIAFFLLLSGYSAQTLVRAQPELVRRVELEANRKQGDRYNVFSLGERGALVMLESEDLTQQSRPYYFWRYDKELNRSWHQIYNVDYKYDFINYAHYGNFYYFLFQRNAKEVLILEVNTESGAGRIIEYANIVKADILQFEVLDGIMLFGGESKGKPFVVYFAPDRAFAKVLPGIQQVETYLADIHVDSTYQRIFVTLSGKTRRQKNVFVNVYNLQGERSQTHTIENNVEYKLLDFKPFVAEEDNILIFGNFAYKNWEKIQGIYVTSLSDPEVKPTIYAYDLANFNNYFNFYKEKRRKRLLRKVDALKKRGKRKRYQYEWFTYDLKLQNDLLFFSADSYRPNYQANRGREVFDPLFYRTRGFASPFDVRSIFGYYYRYDPFAPTVANRRRRYPTSYDYKSTFVCAFTQKGVPVWDNSFFLDDLSQDEPHRPTAFHYHQDSLAVVQFHEGEMRYRKTYRSQKRPKDDIQEIEDWEKHISDTIKVVSRYNETFQHWYDDSFLLSGYQRVRSTNPSNPIRRTFYLSRIRYGTKTQEQE